jgi:hypothetical protein
MTETILYGTDDDETLIYDTPEERAEKYFEDYPLLEAVKIFPYKRRVVDTRYPNVLENLLGWLDDEYGGEDITESTEKMKEAEKVFLSAIIAEYKVLQCEICGPGVVIKRSIK